MHFKFTLLNIQHIKELNFSVDLSKNELMCIVGKNGVGKTTLIRSIKTLKYADTFTETASPYIFNHDSCIIYTINGKEYNFKYNVKLKVIDTKTIIDDEIKNSIYVELPIPHGERFNFKRLSKIDGTLRKNISLREYTRPDELILFLSNVYNSDRFVNLKEISVKGSKYYFILRDDDFYIREDYLSSGEYFVINLYKMIQRKCKLIVIDEIDISLDASAQVNLLKELRAYCSDYEVNIIFTTHSLPLMKMLIDSELYYMEKDDSVVSLRNASYHYVKSILFGFQGWGKYILTEDKVLKEYLEYLISQSREAIFFEYIIIYIGGAQNVVDLMNRNKKEQFFSSLVNVIAVLDGDQRSYSFCEEDKDKDKKIFFIPFESVEKQLKEHYDRGGRDGLPFVKQANDAKQLYKSLTKTEKMSNVEIFSFISERKTCEVEKFSNDLITFLNYR